MPATKAPETAVRAMRAVSIRTRRWRGLRACMAWSALGCRMPRPVWSRMEKMVNAHVRWAARRYGETRGMPPSISSTFADSSPDLTIHQLRGERGVHVVLCHAMPCYDASSYCVQWCHVLLFFVVLLKSRGEVGRTRRALASLQATGGRREWGRARAVSDGGRRSRRGASRTRGRSSDPSSDGTIPRRRSA